MTNFLIIVGAQKCGTTTLYAHMCRSQHFLKSYTKELHYFDKTNNCSRENYISKFEKRSDGKCYLESTPSYLYLDEAPKKIRNTLNVDTVKIVVCVRNPVDRAYSQYLMNRRRNDEHEKFDLAFKRMSSRGVDNYYHRGMYAEQIEKYIQAFGLNNVLVLQMESDFACVPKLNRKLNFFSEVDLNLPECLPQENLAWEFKNNFIGALLTNEFVRSVGRSKYLVKVREKAIDTLGKKATNKSKLTAEQYAEYAEYFKEQKKDLENLLETDITWVGFDNSK